MRSPTGGSGAPALAWYAAYGSNLHLPRLCCYLAGGTPRGASRHYPGCRDPRAPRRSRGISIPGELRFAGSSPVWGGGVATLVATEDGTRAAARAYLLTREQVADVLAQETHREPGAVVDLDDEVLADTGLYDRIAHLGHLEGHPVYTMRSSRPGPARPPTAAYLRIVVSGLARGLGWSARRCADYLAHTPGTSRHWAREEIAAFHPETPG